MKPSVVIIALEYSTKIEKTAKRLLKEGYVIKGIVAASESGIKDFVKRIILFFNKGEPLYAFAEKNKIPFKKISTQNRDEKNLTMVKEWIEDKKPDIMICLGWLYRISKDAINSAPVAINCHSSYLPNYRGSNCVVAPLINMERTTGISVHYMTADIDCGDVIYRESVPIKLLDSYYTLLYRIGMRMPNAVSKALSNIQKNIPTIECGCSGYHPPLKTHRIIYYYLRNRLRALCGLSPVLINKE